LHELLCTELLKLLLTWELFDVREVQYQEQHCYTGLVLCLPLISKTVERIAYTTGHAIPSF